MSGSFCTRALWVYDILLSVDYMIVDPIFHKRTSVRRAENSLVVCLVLRKQQLGISFAIQIAVTQLVVGGRNDSRVLFASCFFQRWFDRIRPPRPGVTKQESG